ncbi:MAG: LytR C-terminal domain-containing protein [Candidatus Latescibacteria bacterium]|nr:LytR C-terminal domain-containing protein [Candidatus Latescibacterota bacterium]
MKNSFIPVVVISLAITIFSLVSLIILNRTHKETFKPDRGENYSVRVAVFNGCGRVGLASMFAQKLRSDGFDVVNGQGGNADSFDFETSVVVDRKGVGKKAEAVSKALGIEIILEQRSDDPYLIEDVAVVLGRDWSTLLKTKGETTD